MENKINIAELLKDCPNGMELDCLLLDNVTFERVTEDGIWIKHIDSKSCECSLLLYNDGSFPIHNLGSLPTKCVIFPKGKNTWEGFVPPCRFKDGDIIANDEYIAIFHKCGKPDSCISNHVVYYHCRYDKKYKDSKFEKDYGIGRYYKYRFATEEEKQKLFDAIKEHGHKWNPETKTFDKLLKFKAGDKVTNGNIYITIGYVDNKYYYDETGRDISNILSIKNQDDWELVPNKFDISTLIPFESRVLVRDYGSHVWEGEIYTRYANKSFNNCNFVTLGGLRWKECIPYEGNEHLLGKTDDCEEYYKTWE